MEAQAKNIIKAIVSRPEIVEATREQLARMVAERNPGILEELRKAERRVRDIEHNRKKLLELCYKNAITADQFKSENDRMTAEERFAMADVLTLQGKLNALKSKGANLGLCQVPGPLEAKIPG